MAQTRFTAVLDKVGELIDILANIKPPAFLNPNSPTPFEIGLRGAASAAALLTSQMAKLVAVPTLAEAAQGIAALNLASAAGPGLGGANGSEFGPAGGGSPFDRRPPGGPGLGGAGGGQVNIFGPVELPGVKDQRSFLEQISQVSED